MLGEYLRACVTPVRLCFCKLAAGATVVVLRGFLAVALCVAFAAWKHGSQVSRVDKKLPLAYCIHDSSHIHVCGMGKGRSGEEDWGALVTAYMLLSLSDCLLDRRLS